MLSADWVDAVVEIVGRVTREAYRHLGLNTCVHSSRVLHTVLRREGVRSKPRAVAVLACNAESYAQLEHGEPTSGVMLYTGPNGKNMPQNPRAKVRTGEAWDAHMVLEIPTGIDDELIIADVTALQFSYPEHGIIVKEPITFDVPVKYWTSEFPGGIPLPDGGGIVYHPLPDHVPEANSWKTTSAWTTEADVIRAIADVCTAHIARLNIPREVSRENA